MVAHLQSMWRQRLAQTCNTAIRRLIPSPSFASASHQHARALSSSSSPSSTSASTPSDAPFYKYITPATLLEGVPKPVERALSIDNANAQERKQAEKQTRIRKFGLRPGDTGSTPVQGKNGNAFGPFYFIIRPSFHIFHVLFTYIVACLQVRIDHIKEHCQNNRQDKPSKRAYTRLLTRRRDLLKYLRRKDFAAYQNTLKELNITGFT